MLSFKRHKNLRVLHLPVNIRWIMDATIKGEEEIGIKTKTLLISRSGLDESREGEVWDSPCFYGSRRFSFAYIRYLISIALFFLHYIRLLIWADVVHWQYSNRLWVGDGLLKNLDFYLIQLFNKPAIVQFHGGDFRNSAEWVKTNPWWSEAYEPDFLKELDERACNTQDAFAEADFCFALGYGMYPFVKPENRDRSVILERGIILQNQSKICKSHSKIKIVHAPSHPTAKGTKYILNAVESLKNKYDIDFVLIENMSHDVVLENLQEADIVIDQLLCGDYGLFAVEAMNAGAAVVANVNEALRAEYSASLPIVQADPDSIYEVLENLIRDKNERERVALQGPTYARKFHSYRSVLPHVLEAYRFAAEKKDDKFVMQKIDEYLARISKKGE